MSQLMRYCELLVAFEELGVETLRTCAPYLCNSGHIRRPSEGSNPVDNCTFHRRDAAMLAAAAIVHCAAAL